MVLAGGGRYDNLAKVLGGEMLVHERQLNRRIINEMKETKIDQCLKMFYIFFTQIGPLAKRKVCQFGEPKKAD